MKVFRISRSKYAISLSVPGVAARWNSEGQKLIYTASTIALACLENLAHRSGTDLSKQDFSIINIEIEDSIKINEINLKDLKKLNFEWYSVENYSITQEIGDKWAISLETAVLKVPSAIIESEFNYLINVFHPDFSKVKIVEISKFLFDPRLK